MDDVKFLDFLKENKNELEIRKYIIENGKEGKPFCPIMFMKENNDDSKDDK